MGVLKVFGKFLFVLVCIIGFLLMFVTSCSVTSSSIVAHSRKPWSVEWEKTGGTIVRSIDVDTVAQTGYDLYFPGQPEAKEYALILYVHGGGYNSGDKADGEMLCKFYASQGYVCASVNYKLASGGINANFDLIFEQLRQQAESIKNYAAREGYNLTAMATSGDSAGGHLAMLYAYREPESSPIPIKLVFQMTGPASFDPGAWGITDPVEAAKAVSQMTGTLVMPEWMEQESTKELIKSISPALLVNAETVPSVLAYGPKDKVVLPSLKFPLLDALKEHGVDYTYIEFPNSGHAMAFDPDKSQEYVDTVKSYLEKYMPA